MSTKTTDKTKESTKTGTKPQVAIGDLSAKGDVRGGRGKTKVPTQPVTEPDTGLDKYVPTGG